MPSFDKSTEGMDNIAPSPIPDRNREGKNSDRGVGGNPFKLLKGLFGSGGGDSEGEEDMPFWAAAAPIIGAVLGGIAGNRSAKASGKPTHTKTTIGAPPAELGGYGRISSALDRARDFQPYRVGSNNPYMQNTFSHVLGRAGMQAPEGGYGGNPYMPRGIQPSDNGSGMGGGTGLPPEIIQFIREMLAQRQQAQQGQMPGPGGAMGAQPQQPPPGGPGVGMRPNPMMQRGGM